MDYAHLPMTGGLPDGAVRPEAYVVPEITDYRLHITPRERTGGTTHMRTLEHSAPQGYALARDGSECGTGIQDSKKLIYRTQLNG